MTSSPLLTASVALVVLTACSSTGTSDRSSREALDADAMAAEKLDRAQTSLDAGDPRTALAVLDEVVAARPDDADAWLLRARAATAAAEGDPQALFFYKDALRDYERAVELRPTAEVYLDASRAARLALEPRRALELAELGREALAAAPARPDLEEPPEKVVAEAGFAAYLDARSTDQDADAYRAITEDALQDYVGDHPDDPWGYVQLANLQVWEEDLEGAVQTLERGLDRAPEEAALHDRYVTVQRDLGGREAVYAAYDAFNAEHRDSALAAWFVGVELVAEGAEQVALARAGELERVDAELFRRAEALFRRCRELAPEYEADCKGYEAIARAGEGWAQLEAGELDAAEESFESMEDVFENGMQWQLPGRLMSGVVGLQFVADAHAQAGGPAGNAAAAEVFDQLYRYDEENADFANNAGFFHREAGAEQWFEAQRLTARSEEAEATEAEALLRRALALRNEAREHMRQSWEAYQAAVERNPEDVRVTNDAALVQVWHVRDDPEIAERFLLRAIEMGREQLDDPDLDPEERDALQEAWGDAHQNMGILYLLEKDDPEQALGWFEKCVEIGPHPRVDRAIVRDGWIPLAKAKMEGREIDVYRLDPRLFPKRG